MTPVARTADTALVSPAAFLRAIRTARAVALSAYTLEPGGAVASALVSAADRGASVSVTLEDFGRAGAARDLRRRAAAVARELRAHGVRVSLGVPSGATVHLKAAVVDGTAYLNDRNWAQRGETIVATSRRCDVAATRSAIAGRPRSSDRLSTEKTSALAREADAIRGGADRIDVESESFGASGVAAALRSRAERGVRVRLLVNDAIARERRSSRERALLRELAAAGVDVRTSGAREKVCVAGDRGWVGSANATFDVGSTTDWGLAVGEGKMLGDLAATFERNWAGGRPFP